MHCPETPLHQPFNPANTGHKRKKAHIWPGEEKRRAAFKEERRKISPEEQQARDNNGGNPQLYLVSRSLEAKHERLLNPGKQKRPAYG
jgi:hypothetical protein